MRARSCCANIELDLAGRTQPREALVVCDERTIGRSDARDGELDVRIEVDFKSGGGTFEPGRSARNVRIKRAAKAVLGAAGIAEIALMPARRPISARTVVKRC